MHLRAENMIMMHTELEDKFKICSYRGKKMAYLVWLSPYNKIPQLAMDVKAQSQSLWQQISIQCYLLPLSKKDSREKISSKCIEQEASL